MMRFNQVLSLVIAGFVLWVLVLSVLQWGPEDERPEAPPPQGLVKVDPELARKIAVVKGLLDNKDIAQAERLLGELTAAYPFEGEPYFLQGEICLHRQDPIGAMMAYRRAVDLNCDFLDDRASLFQGKKIKKTAEEARSAIEEGLVAKPGDPYLLKARKTYFHLLRKIAGTCG